MSDEEPKWITIDGKDYRVEKLKDGILSDETLCYCCDKSLQKYGNPMELTKSYLLLECKYCGVIHYLELPPPPELTEEEREDDLDFMAEIEADNLESQLSRMAETLTAKRGGEEVVKKEGKVPKATRKAWKRLKKKK